MARGGLLRVLGRVLPMRRALLAAAAAVALAACSAGTSPIEKCVEHSVEEGVDAETARAACEDALN